ncbi:MAG TPA: DUF4395 domain-containing protein [Herpetosiphonaceae bacterium]
MAQATVDPQPADGIPLPVVKLNRWTLLAGILLGLATGQPWLTTILFALLLPAVLLGPRFSPIFLLGSALFARANATAEREDRRLMRFNNTIALVLLGAAQVAFLLGAPVLGWAFALMVAAAAGVALAGFCLGCFLYYQFKINRTRLFG